MDENYFRKIMTGIILIALIVLTFFLLKPILLSVIVGFILAFLLTPVYNLVYKITKSKNLSAALICVLLIALIFLPFWFLTPIFLDQSFKIYVATQQMDFVKPLKAIFPSLFSSEAFSAEIGSIVYSFATKITNSLMNSFADLILNFPTLFLQFLVVLFVFFFALRDKNEIISYTKSLLPFPKETEEKIFKRSKEITISVLYGQIIVGIILGIIVGAGFFIFNVPNALILTLLAVLAGIIPLIGTTIIWIPTAIYILIAGNFFSALGITVFGLIASSLDSFLKPIIISKRSKMHPALTLIGMIGGFFLFGILGFILGPLIFAYLIIIIEIYRNRNLPDILIQTG